MLLRSSPPGMICALLALLPSGPAAVPEGAIGAPGLAELRVAWEAARHSALPAGAGAYEAHNPGERWRTRFDGRGFTVEPDTASWTWGLALVGYGLGRVEPLSEPNGIAADGPRVAYDWDGVLEEWWVNDSRGLEHGFSLQHRPAGSAPSLESDPCRLSLLLSVRGELRPEVEAGGRDVRFLDERDAVVLTYRGLLVLDADGKALEAGFELVPEGLLLTVEEEGARYPLTIDPIVQRAYLKASNPGAQDHFGLSVAVSGDTAVVGAPAEDSNATGVDGNQANNSASDAGAVYVFVRDGPTWSQQAYLKASNTESNDNFGHSVAISGDTVVVGARGEDSGVGAAYVFVRNGTTWSQQAYLKASNPQVSDAFGQAVSISGETVVVSAPNEDSNATGVNGDQTNNSASTSGAAYVFVRDGSTWSQQAYLKASNTESGDRFGQAVSISGETVVVSALFEDSNASGVNGNQASNSALEAGAAYVFVRDGTAWSQQAYLKASNTDANDFFGLAVAISGDMALIGAPQEDSHATGVDGDQASNAAMAAGAAYLFVRSGTTWSQLSYLKASNTGSGDQFGASVALSDGTALVGAPTESSSARGPYGDPTSNSAFGAGAIYVFTRRGGAWEQAYVKASNTDANDQFGYSVAIAGQFALGGAPTENGSAAGVNGDPFLNNLSDSGAVYAFELCPRATVGFRNGGSNPASYVASPAVLGGTFTATVNNVLAGQTSSLLFAFDTPTSFALAGGQTLLCIDLGSGELFTGASLHPASSAGGVDSYTLAIPNLPALGDSLAHTQALQFGNPPFVLSNAQDLTLGAF